MAEDIEDIREEEGGAELDYNDDIWMGMIPIFTLDYCLIAYLSKENIHVQFFQI